MALHDTRDSIMFAIRDTSAASVYHKGYVLCKKVFADRDVTEKQYSDCTKNASTLYECPLVGHSTTYAVHELGIGKLEVILLLLVPV